MEIRLATTNDWPGIWAIFRDIVGAGETYAYAPDTTEDEARRVWLEAPLATYVAIDGGTVLGTYYIKANQPGLGDHVCNAGYMVAADARGKGLGRAMCAHSLDEARRLGFAAMQYNLVAASNEGAIKLWHEMGFQTIGTLPLAFRHATLGPIDALVMYRLL